MDSDPKFLKASKCSATKGVLKNDVPVRGAFW